MPAKDTELDFGQYWRMLKRHWLLALLVFGGTAAAISALGFIQTPVYQAEGKLRFKSQDAVSALTGIEEDKRGQLESLDFRESPIATEIGLIQTTPVIESTIETLDLRNEEGELVSEAEFLAGLEVMHESGTDLLQVIYRSPDPAVATVAVDTLMAVYLRQHLLDNRSQAVAAREFLEDQLPKAEAKASQAEAALRAFKERNNIVALTSETEDTVESLGDIKDEITAVTAQLFDADAQFRTLQTQIGESPESALVATAVSQSEGIQELLQNYQATEATLATQRTRYRSGHPEIVSLEASLASLRRLLAQRVGNVAGSQNLSGQTGLQMSDVEAELIGDYVRLQARVNGLRQQAEALINAEASFSSRAKDLPKLEQEQNELERRLEAARSIYTLLLQRLQEVLVVENQNVGNATVVQPANVLADPVSPNKKLYVAGGILLGSLLALSSALLMEVKDDSIKTVEEIKRALDFPVIGIIPLFDEVTSRLRSTSQSDNSVELAVPELVINDENDSIASEAFHMLRSNLKFLNSDRPPELVVVTSSVAGEGKSTVSSNLAASMAQTGKSVLLIDADFHRPVQHWVWSYTSRSGLSDLLVGDAEMRDCMKEVMPNLWLIPAGSIPPSPASLLDSQKMTRLLEAFRSRFDYVIIDSPPISGGASASILGKMSDGLLLVTRPEVADTASVHYTKELIERFHQSVLGVVVNGAMGKYEPYNYFLTEEFPDGTVVNQARYEEPPVRSSVASRR